MSRVVVVGDVVTDILAVHSGPLAVDSDTMARISVAGGGSGANTAAWLAYIGRPVALVGVVGADVAGTDRLAELEAVGVDCAAVRRTSQAPTGTVIVLTRAQDRTMLTDRGANLLLLPSDVDNALDHAGHLHLSGYTLLDAASRPAGLHALRAATERSLTTSVDAASAAPLARVGAGAFLDWIRGVDLLLANLDEALVLTNSTVDAAGAARALTSVVGQTVVKQGPAGAVWASSTTVVSEPAAAVAIVDSTGAGDAFAAALLDAWLGGADPATALRAGVRLGAVAVTTVGGRPPSISG